MLNSQKVTDKIDKELPYLLALLRLPKIGPVKIKAILGQISSEKISSLKSLFTEEGTCIPFPSAGKADWQAVEKDLKWSENSHHHILTWEDPEYPALLKEIHSAPPVLFVEGNKSLLAKPQLAIVGSRNPTATGRETSVYFAGCFAEMGWVVTSGLALGIDASAHQGTLQKSGHTLAVLANGLDHIYPPQHKKLAQEIAERGALVSEFPIGVVPIPSHFPRRNRIISGLSVGTLVVEAGMKSGSLITAEFALEQGREVFAIPGSIYSSQSKGNHVLIRSGAKLVETPEDVLEELRPLLKYVSLSTKNSGDASNVPEGISVSAPRLPNKNSGLYSGINSALNKRQQALLVEIGFESVSLDLLVKRTGLTIGEVSSILLELELKGWVHSVRGGYARVAWGRQS